MQRVVCKGDEHNTPPLPWYNSRRHRMHYLVPDRNGCRATLMDLTVSISIDCSSEQWEHLLQTTFAPASLKHGQTVILSRIAMTMTELFQESVATYNLWPSSDQ